MLRFHRLEINFVSKVTSQDRYCTSSHNMFGRGLGSGLYSQAGHCSTARSDQLGSSCSGQPRSTDYHCNKNKGANHSHSRNSINLLNLHNGLNSTAHRPSMRSESGDARVYFNIRVKCWVFMWTIRGSMRHVSVTFYRTYVHCVYTWWFLSWCCAGPSSHH